MQDHEDEFAVSVPILYPLGFGASQVEKERGDEIMAESFDAAADRLRVKTVMAGWEVEQGRVGIGVVSRVRVLTVAATEAGVAG